MKIAGWLLSALALAGCGSGSEPSRSTSQIASGERIFRRCTACHTIGQYAPDTDGPNLYGVVGGPIGERRQRFPYTAGLKALAGTCCGSAWKKDPGSGVIGVEKGPLIPLV
jgi:cytochrome c